ncbi:hypothetical protein W97_08050 [Coniosporium apollinis CBS 100218]|uniref:TRIP4/RQT4 C2HC5-type zinc finger domain-containing protein n=1 Tax=Coniosporium apollinis (strain CBS 100218) TaxID=1168221 RepID=R7Z3P5_CONA1|nr:uncharacterized protein W97_08050 [Coniosporium apollinis CBS 100218]EON68792.1 hypothetical protein W97_08050 [Coniosporium apollinis CBS 100218]
MDLNSWALPQLSRLLPLDEGSLRQIITYTDTLPKNAAAEHLKNLLGDSPQALEFITSFNSRRAAAPDEPSSQQGHREQRSDVSEVPRARPRQQKKPNQFNKLPPARRPEDYGNQSGGYIKKDEQDYMSGASRARKEPQLANALQLQEKPDARQLPSITSKLSATNPAVPTPKPPPSAAGPLISDIKSNSRPSSRQASPAPKPSAAKTKVAITGGTSMHGSSSTLSDLDSAIRALEIQTNPSLSTSSREDTLKRRCNCMATRHPLLAAAPNCLSCGKIICVKEGLGPCTFCERPLLSQSEIQGMVRVLKEERGREKMDANNLAQRRAEVSKAPRAFTSVSGAASPVVSRPGTPTSDSERLSAALAHRDKLLDYQAQNARRTRIHDEAADFETPSSGQSMWASPAERALQLKRQQKVLREQEWSARPEWEKRKVVASIDLVGGKVVKRMERAERPRTPESEGDGENGAAGPVQGEGRGGGGGAFSRNPLLGALIRPTIGESGGKGKEVERERRTAWRRVQDDKDDNEQWILDGGAYGGTIDGRRIGDEEHGHGS